MSPAAETDLWRKSYENPPIFRANAHALLYTVPEETQKWRAEVHFTLEGSVEYDQAGIVVYSDDAHWLKSGIEYVGGIPLMSCVVTNENSDWSYVRSPTAADVRVRVTCTRVGPVARNCLVEYFKDGGWEFLREAPLILAEGSTVKVGLTCCAPTSAGMSAFFHSLSFTKEN